MEYGRRGGRVQVNFLQYMELVKRVDNLEAFMNKKEVIQDIELTKNDIMKDLDDKGIKYNPRDRKDILQELLNNEVDICLNDKPEQV